MTTTYTLNTRFTRTPRGIHYVALTALTLLFGCGAHDTDLAGPSMADEPAEPSDAVVETTASSDEPVLLGVGDSTLSATEKDRSGTADPTEQIATTNHRSGERIQARFLSTSEGQLTWQGWQDAALGEECSFQLDDQGTMRCFPVNGTDQLVYSNSECTRGFVSGDPAAEQTPPNYYFYRKDTGCGEGIRAYEIADTSEALETVYARNAQRECVPVEAAGRTFRALAAPIDPARFVAAEYGAIESSSRIKGYGLLTEDGAIQVTGFMDADLGTTCMWTGAETANCFPQGQAIDRFADRELSIPLMKDESSSCSDPLATVGVQHGDAGTARYYRRGDRFDGATVYGVIPQVVDGPAAIEVAEPYYRTEEIAVSRFAKATVHSDVTSRLNPVYWNTDDGSTWFSHWYDLALGSSCTFTAEANGSALCLPNTTGSRVVYTDAACGTPVAEIDANCGNERPQFAMEHVADESNPHINVRRLQTAIALKSVYELTDAGCTMSDVRNEKAYLDLSDPLPPEAFVSASAMGDDAIDDEPVVTGGVTIDPVR